MININHLKCMSCIGYRGYDDEWYPDSRYRQYLKIDNHHYQVHIWKRKKNSWGLRVNLCLTTINSDDIIVVEKSAKTMKELKQIAVDEINAYHNSHRCTCDIEKWKKSHGKKVFDKDFNYLGVSYTSPDREKNNTEFDYYNDNKPQIGYGTYYMLEENSVMVCKISYMSSVTTWDKSQELREKILGKCKELEV